MVTERERPDECESCLWPTPALTLSGDPPRSDEGWLCEVCRSTFAGSAFHHPRQHPDATVLRMLAWGFNFLAAEIRGPEFNPADFFPTLVVPPGGVVLGGPLKEPLLLLPPDDADSQPAKETNDAH